MASYPELYQINTRVWLTELSGALGRSATLDDISDGDLDNIAAMGFDWIWLLSVWQTGTASRQVSRTNREWNREFAETLADLTDADIEGSGFAISSYRVHDKLGGDAALAKLRERMKQKGLRLMLDFVPNHTALDHPWVVHHPQYYVHGTETDLAHNRQNYTCIENESGRMILAHGRDPYFPGWQDTLQLNYANDELQQAMSDELIKISSQCDGVRCDMAMLPLPEIFKQTWGQSCRPFWPDAIARVKAAHSQFCFLGEVYWNLEWSLQQQGFDYAYDKRLYDRLREGVARPVREHLMAGSDYQNKLARFLENHDEPRAAAVFPVEIHQAAATITFLTPGMRFIHQGQLQGKTKKISPHLIRGPIEAVDGRIAKFYSRILSLLKLNVLRNGKWQLTTCLPAWEGNWTWDCFVAFLWESDDGERLFVAVNYSDHQSQCYAQLPVGDLSADARLQLQDLLGDDIYLREGKQLRSPGLYLDMPAWHSVAFSVSQVAMTEAQVK